MAVKEYVCKIFFMVPDVGIGVTYLINIDDGIIAAKFKEVADEANDYSREDYIPVKPTTDQEEHLCVEFQ